MFLLQSCKLQFLLCLLCLIFFFSFSPPPAFAYVILWYILPTMWALGSATFLFPHSRIPPIKKNGSFWLSRSPYQTILRKEKFKRIGLPGYTSLFMNGRRRLDFLFFFISYWFKGLITLYFCIIYLFGVYLSK